MNNTLQADLRLESSGSTVVCGDDTLTCNVVGVKVVNYRLSEQENKGFAPLRNNAAFDFWNSPDEDVY